MEIVKENRQKVAKAREKVHFLTINAGERIIQSRGENGDRERREKGGENT